MSKPSDSSSKFCSFVVHRLGRRTAALVINPKVEIVVGLWLGRDLDVGRCGHAARVGTEASALPLTGARPQPLPYSRSSLRTTSASASRSHNGMEVTPDSGPKASVAWHCACRASRRRR